MDDNEVTSKHEVVTEEPASGWLRYEVEGSTPWYKSPVPRTVLKSSRKVALFLEKEHAKGKMMDVNVNQFSFKRRLGLLKTSSKGSQTSAQVPLEIRKLAVEEDKPKTLVEHLTNKYFLIFNYQYHFI